MKNRYLRHEDFELNRLFLDELRDKGGDAGHMYYILFNKLEPEDLNKELEYINDLRLGRDKFYGEKSKDNWFYIFHKGVRQSDYFQNVFIRKEMSLIDDTELKEMRYLRGLLIDEKIKKRDENGDFTKEYRRYLQLHELKRREIVEENISGVFDALLWGLVHLDKDEVLYKTFELVFEKYRINNLKLEKEKV